MDELVVRGIPGLPEIAPGDDLPALIGEAAVRAGAAPGDILAVTSKIVSKAEGRIVHAADREQAITDETVRVVATRARADGGTTRIVMRGPDGTEFASSGVYLELVENARIVFTDAYTRAWEPAAKPFFTGIITFTPEGGATRYTALARHWTEDDRATHEAMGFHDGWGRCADQLADLVARL